MDHTDPIPKKLFDILTCPVCKSSLKYFQDKKSLTCVKCKTKYEVKKGIPILLPPKK